MERSIAANAQDGNGDAPGTRPYSEHNGGQNHHNHNHNHNHAVPDKVPALTFGGVLIVVALSFHSVFEGLSLGLQSSASKTWIMLLAIALHKLVISFVLGFELCTSGVKKVSVRSGLSQFFVVTHVNEDVSSLKSAVLVYVVIFSVMSPFGAFMGIMTQHHFEETLVVTVLNGIAAGTLLYVTFFEVLQKQKNLSLHGMFQLTAVILGFSLMLALELMLPHSHQAHEDVDHHHH
ncbi:zinc/iron transporter-like [Tropilaelaps mercedesae]|uniref:Zinc/iron transporter-like n=1 Tax=Tropilaelaps mercedesae TaxID=418985 RepID=A0A1V9XAQ4_9ACAR|nr:zinc/iron transporter-like [Tropilaelaps mercedesae]